MTKIIKIKVENLKSVKEQELYLNGCTAIITGANNSGKSSILKSLIDRIQSKKPEMIVKQGEVNGFYEMDLSDGCRIFWKFTEKTDSISYITKEGFTVKTGVIEQLQTKYLGAKKQFDIDKFLQSSPKDQEKMLCQIIGIDFSKIDLAYKNAYNERAQANSDLKAIVARKVDKPVVVECPNIHSLMAQKAAFQSKIELELHSIRTKNNVLRNDWDLGNDKLREEIGQFNDNEKSKQEKIESYKKEEKELSLCLRFFEKCFDFGMAKKIIDELPKPQELKIFKKLPEPDYIAEVDYYSKLKEIESEIAAANLQATKYAIYVTQMTNYNNWVNDGKKAREWAEKTDKKVKEIEVEKQKMIEGSTLPEGFSFSEDGLLYNGFELNRNSQSSSSIYIAGLKLATMNLGALKTVHFDASFLDKKSLLEVEKYAQSLDLQLLIERPDFDGGEISYELIQAK